MKLVIFAVISLCLVLANADVVDPIGYSTRNLEEYVESLAHMADQVEHKYDEVIVQPMERVEFSVNSIEDLKQENEECVVQHDAEVENVVRVLEESINDCSQTAAVDTASVGLEITKLTIKITYGIVDAKKTKDRCDGYKNSILADICYAQLTVKVATLVYESQKAIRLINRSVDETLPQIMHDLEVCSANAEVSALSQLDAIHNEIDSCIGVQKMKFAPKVISKAKLQLLKN